MSIKIEGYLVQRKLEAAIKEIVGDAWVGREIAIPESKLRWDMVYKHSDKMVAVEFDGDSHYRDSLVIKRDREKDDLAMLLDIKLIRIPYWVQLTTETLKFYFDLDAEINQDFPHGFITTKIFPASFCDLGVERFFYELAQLPDGVQDGVIASLHTQSKKHGLSYVMPAGAARWLTLEQDPAYYKRYVELGGTTSEEEFNYHLGIFFELTQEAYTGGSVDRGLAYFWWQQHIKSAEEADLFFRAVDDTHAYS